MQFKTCWRSEQSGANLSPREFPANREKYGEFSQFEDQIRSSNAASIFVFSQISRVHWQIGTANDQGFCNEEQRITRKVSSSRLNSVRDGEISVAAQSNSLGFLLQLRRSFLRAPHRAEFQFLTLGGGTNSALPLGFDGRVP
jgi:hypothetical protein